MFDGNEDVGNPAKKGSATYNIETQEYTMSCGGKICGQMMTSFAFSGKRSRAIL
jgi:hypothetical protein